MASFKRHPHALRLIAFAALSVQILACTQWRDEPIAPQSQAVFDSTKTYRVLLATGQRVVIGHPQVTVDSVIWVVHNADGSTFPPPRHHGINRADVRGVEVEQEPSTLGTVALLFLGVCGLFATLGGTSIGWSSRH